MMARLPSREEIDQQGLRWFAEAFEGWVSDHLKTTSEPPLTSLRDLKALFEQERDEARKAGGPWLFKTFADWLSMEPDGSNDGYAALRLLRDALAAKLGRIPPTAFEMLVRASHAFVDGVRWRFERSDDRSFAAHRADAHNEFDAHLERLQGYVRDLKAELEKTERFVDDIDVRYAAVDLQTLLLEGSRLGRIVGQHHDGLLGLRYVLGDLDHRLQRHRHAWKEPLTDLGPHFLERLADIHRDHAVGGSLSRFARTVYDALPLDVRRHLASSPPGLEQQVKRLTKRRRTPDAT